MRATGEGWPPRQPLVVLRRTVLASRRYGLLPRLGPWLLCIAMTLLAYAPALSAGFMYDDPLDLPRATTRSLGEILRSPGASSYYRPLPLLIWNLLHTLLGRNDPVLLHGLSLLCHATAGWLVYQLGLRLLGRGTGLVAAALFLWYPPNYQVVGFVNVFFHGLAAAGVLAAAVLYWDARIAHDRRRVVLALLAGGLGLLSHESAVTLLPIVIASEALLLSRRQIARPSRLPALFAAETALYGLIWLVMPRLPVHSDQGLASVPSNGLYFLQGLTTPVSSQLGYLPRIGSEASTLLLAAGATLVALIVLLGRRQRLLVGAFGAVWFLAAVTPPWLLLPWESYVSNAPRLLYLASAGMALIWAAALTPPRFPLGVWGRNPHVKWFGARRASQTSAALAATLLIASILGTGFRFIAIREATQTQGAEIVAQVIQSAKANGADAHATYINVPSFLTPRDSGFLFGHWGITMIPQYVYDLGFVVFVAEEIKPSLSSAFFTVLAQDWDHFYGPHGYPEDVRGLQAPLRAGGPVYVTRFEPGRLSLEYVGRLDQTATMAGIAHFADWALIESASARTQGGRLSVHIVWQALGRAPGDYTAFVHVIDATGTQIAQADGYPIAAMFPPAEWRAGDRIEDIRTIALPAGAAPVAVLIGLYDRANPSVRTLAQDAGGTRLPDDALRIPATDVPDVR